VFDKRRFLDLIRYFIAFEDSGDGKITKKMAGYHQFHAVNTAVDETFRASTMGRSKGWDESPGRYEAGRQSGGDPGDRRIGGWWHTQGSGKSLTMAFFAGRLVLHPAMENPPSWCSPTATTWTTSCSAPLPRAVTVCGNPGAGREPIRPAG
jgi:type I restriction enzyme R subunit